jgi:PST family polysaccharide transporter
MSFARVTLGNVLWAFAGTAGARLASLAGLVALARILAPEDFGLVAFALVFTTYIETVGDLGAGMALIYWPSRYDDAAQVSFGINIVMGVLWGGMTLLVAPAVAAFFHEPAATPILRTLALIFPIKALGATHDALLQKQLRFRSRLVPELALAVLKAVASVGLAVAGMGVWSLVWGQIVGLAAWVGVLWWEWP